MGNYRKIFHGKNIFLFIVVAVICGSLGLSLSARICRAAENGFTAQELAAQALRSNAEGITGETVKLYRKLLFAGGDFESRKIQAETAWKILCHAKNIEQLKQAEIIYRIARGLGDEEEIRISKPKASKAIICMYILAKRPNVAANVLHLMEQLGDEPAIREQRAEGIATFMGYTVINGGSAATLPWYRAINTLGTEPAAVAKARIRAALLMMLAWANESNTKGAERVYYDMEGIGSGLDIRLERTAVANIVILSYLVSGNQQRAMALYESTGLLGDEQKIRQRREGIKKAMEYMKQIQTGVPTE